MMIPRLNPYFKILIHWKMSKLDGSDARDDVFDWPLFSQNVEKFETGRTDMNAISDGIRGFYPIHIDKELRINEIGMIC
jgi:hypothetical protein